MRIWSLNPEYLDTKGLVAVWREALLAQKVLKGETKGYKNHPQLNRFKDQVDPVAAIAGYLRAIFREAVNRGYEFNYEKIAKRDFDGSIFCTRGQLLYEWNHLMQKLKSRDTRKYLEIRGIKEPNAHPIFKIIDGAIEGWEVVA